MKTINQRYRAICEGQQEKLYLEHLAGLLTERVPNSDRTCMINFDCSIRSPQQLYKERSSILTTVCLFDYDNDQVKFESSLLACIKCTTKEKAVYHSYSSLCFDLWLLLHKTDFTRPVYNNDDYIPAIRQAYSIQPHENIKRKETIQNMLKQITLEDVKKAVIRAEKIHTTAEQSGTAHIVAGKHAYYDNPDLSIQVFIRKLLELCGKM